MTTNGFKIYGEPGGIYLRYGLSHHRGEYFVVNEDGEILFTDLDEIEVQRFCEDLIERETRAMAL